MAGGGVVSVDGSFTIRFLCVYSHNKSGKEKRGWGWVGDDRVECEETRKQYQVTGFSWHTYWFCDQSDPPTHWHTAYAHTENATAHYLCNIACCHVESTYFLFFFSFFLSLSLSLCSSNGATVTSSIWKYDIHHKKLLSNLGGRGAPGNGMDQFRDLWPLCPAHFIDVAPLAFFF